MPLSRKLRIGGMAPLSVLPRIESGVSLALSDEEEDEEVLPTALNSPTSDTTPVFTKTYNVTDLEGDPHKVERDITQTTIHVLSTPSLTGNSLLCYNPPLHLIWRGVVKQGRSRQVILWF